MSKRVPDPRRDSVQSRVSGGSSPQGSPTQPGNMQPQQHQPSMTGSPSPALFNGGNGRMYTQEQMDAINARNISMKAHLDTLGPEERRQTIIRYNHRLQQQQQQWRRGAPTNATTHTNGSQSLQQQQADQIWAQMTPQQKQAYRQRKQGQLQQSIVVPPSPQLYKHQNGRVYTREEVEAYTQRQAMAMQQMQQQKQQPEMAASPTLMGATNRNGRQYTQQDYENAQRTAAMQACSQTQMSPRDYILFQQQQPTLAMDPAHTLMDNKSGRRLTPEQYEELGRKAAWRAQMAQISPELAQQHALAMAMSPTTHMIENNGRQGTQTVAQALRQQRVPIQSQMTPSGIALRRQQQQRRSQGGQSMPKPTPLTMDPQFLGQHTAPPGSSAFSSQSLGSNAPIVSQMHSPRQSSQNDDNAYFLSPSSSQNQDTNGYQHSNDHLSQMFQAGSPTFSPNMFNSELSNPLQRRSFQQMDLTRRDAFAVPQSPGQFQGQQTNSPVVRMPTPLSASFSSEILGSHAQHLSEMPPPQSIQSPVHIAFSQSSPNTQGANGHRLNTKDMKAKAHVNLLKPRSQVDQKVRKVQKASGNPNARSKKGSSVDPRPAATSAANLKGAIPSTPKPPQVLVKPTPAQRKPTPKTVPSKPAALQHMSTPKAAPSKPTAPQRVPTPTARSSPASEQLLTAGTKRSLPDGEDAYTEGPSPKAVMLSTGPLSPPSSTLDVAKVELQKHKMPVSQAEPLKRLNKEAIKHGVHTLEVPKGTLVVDDAEMNEFHQPGNATAPSPGYAEGMMEIKKKAGLNKTSSENDEKLLPHSSSSEKPAVGLPAKPASSNGQMDAPAMCSPHEVIDLTGEEEPVQPDPPSPCIAASEASNLHEAGQPANDEPGVHRLHLFALQNGVRMDDVEYGSFIRDAMTSYLDTQKELQYNSSMLDPSPEILEELAKTSASDYAPRGTNMMDAAHAEALGLTVDFSMHSVLKKVRDPHYDGFRYSGNSGGVLPPSAVDPMEICTKEDDGSLRAPDNVSMSEEGAVLGYNLLKACTDGGKVCGGDERERATRS